jgi:twitching motility protein PilI
MTEPFQKLQEIERQCRSSAALLPGLESHKDDWDGIGFSLGSYKLLSVMNGVSEILDLPEYTRVPGVKPWMMGIGNVRGSLLPLIDLKNFLIGESVQNIKNSRVLVTGHANYHIGLVVDEVLGMRHFTLSEQIYELPEINTSLMPYIKQAFKRDGEYWPVFSFDILIEDEQFLHASL